MKSVQSRVFSSNPISLSDATSFLSDFTASVCGDDSRRASQDTRCFIRRALASFQELDLLHLKHKDPRSDRNRRQNGSDRNRRQNGSDRNRRQNGSDAQNDDAETTTVQAQSFAASRDVSSKHRRQESDVINLKVEVEEQSKCGGEIGEVDDKKKKKKKSKKVEGEIKEEEDGESKMEDVKEEDKKKKRKSAVLENGGSDGAEEQHEKRKKRRKN